MEMVRAGAGAWVCREGQRGTGMHGYVWSREEREEEHPNKRVRGSVGVGKGGGHMGSAMVCMTSSLDLEIDVLASQTHRPGVG